MTLGSGRVVCPSPLSVGLVVLLEFLDEQVADASLAGEVSQRHRGVGGQAGGEFHLPAFTSDVVRGVLGDGVPEVVHIASAVFLVGRLLPDFTNLVSDTVSENATLHQPVQQFVTFLLIEFRATEQVERFVLRLETTASDIDCVGGELDIHGSSMLTHQVDTAIHRPRSVTAHDPHQSHDQRDFHRAVERITKRDTHLEVILLHLEAVIGEGVVGVHPRAVLRDFAIASELHPLRVEDGFSLLDEVLVLHDGVAFRDSLEAHTRVLADIAVERGGRTIGEVEAFLRDEVEGIVRHLALRDFCGLIFHMRFWYLVFWFWVLSP